MAYFWEAGFLYYSPSIVFAINLHALFLKSSRWHSPLTVPQQYTHQATHSTVHTLTLCNPFNFWWVKASAHSSGKMSDRMEQPGQRGTVKSRWKSFPKVCELDKSPPASSVWVGGLFDVMRRSCPPPPQLHLVNPSLSKVRRRGSGLSFCRLEDDPRVFQEQQSQPLSESPPGPGVTMFVWCLRVCLFRETVSCKLGPPSLRLHCLCVLVCLSPVLYIVSGYSNGNCQIILNKV